MNSRTKRTKPTYEFRPLKDFLRGVVRRYADGQWLPDDGATYDLAFIDGRHCLYIDVGYRPNILWSWYDKHWSSREPRHPSGNAWHYMLTDGATDWGDDWGKDRHENERAGRNGMEKVCSESGSASGLHIEWHLDDPHIAAGLVRERDSKEIVKFPDTPICMYCGPLKFTRKAA